MASSRARIERDGRRVYLAGRGYPYLVVASTANNRIIRRIGPLLSGGRPFTINGRETIAYTTANDLLGFQVSSIKSGKRCSTRFAFRASPTTSRATEPTVRRLTESRSRPTSGSSTSSTPRMATSMYSTSAACPAHVRGTSQTSSSAARPVTDGCSTAGTVATSTSVARGTSSTRAHSRSRNCPSCERPPTRSRSTGGTVALSPPRRDTGSYTSDAETWTRPATSPIMGGWIVPHG